jgi:hypothetical protein
METARDRDLRLRAASLRYQTERRRHSGAALWTRIPSLKNKEARGDGPCAPSGKRRAYSVHMCGAKAQAGNDSS